MLSFWDPNFLGFDKWTAPGVPPRSRMRNGVRLTSLFYLDHRFLTIPPYPEMVLRSSENPSKIGSLSRVSHAANEANAPLFSHFHRPPFPLLLLKTIARSSRVQMHPHVRVLASTLLPTDSSPSCWDPLQTVLDPRPGSRLTLPSLQPTFSQKAAFKSFRDGPSHVGKGLRQNSLFSVMLMLASKPPGIRMGKKSSESRNDSSWMCEGAGGGRQPCPHGGPLCK